MTPIPNCPTDDDSRPHTIADPDRMPRVVFGPVWCVACKMTSDEWSTERSHDAQATVVRARCHGASAFQIVPDSAIVEATALPMRIEFFAVPADRPEVPYSSYARVASYRDTTKTALADVVHGTRGIIVGDLAVPAPPTDTEIVESIDHLRAKQVEYRPTPILMPSGHVVTINEQRAAMSRVLAAMVRASDEKRRRDAMVYGPIDDGDEAGAKDA